MHCEKPRWRHSLAARLLVSYLAALVLTAAVVGGGAAVLLAWFPGVLDNLSLTAHARHIARDLQWDAQGRPAAVVRPPAVEWIYAAVAQDIKYRVVDATGQVVLASEPQAQALAPPGLPFDGLRSPFGVTLGDRTFQVAAVQVPRPAAYAQAPPYYVQVGLSQRANDLARLVMTLPLARAAFWTGLLSVVLLSAVLAYTLRRALVPLSEASAAAAHIEPRNLGARLSTQRMPTELQPLINAFNQVLERLQQGYRVQQEFLGAAAHELKTPLALVRGQIELSLIDDRDTVLKDIDFMARQVHQLLHLAEASEPQNYSFEPTEPGAVAGDVVGQLGRLADGRRVCLDLRVLPGSTAVRADRGALFVLVKNLVENAILHSPCDAMVAVTVGPGDLCVRDEGAGIADEHLPKLFVRFWRGPGRRDSGAGLGLAICREIAIAHGWQLSARNAVRGAEFVLRFDAPGNAGA
jgi:two-component system sensor histidine kinase QseC